MPTGSVRWLCAGSDGGHQKGDHITVMTGDTAQAPVALPMIAEDDLLLKVLEAQGLCKVLG